MLIVRSYNLFHSRHFIVDSSKRRPEAIHDKVDGGWGIRLSPPPTKGTKNLDASNVYQKFNKFGAAVQMFRPFRINFDFNCFLCEETHYIFVQNMYQSLLAINSASFSFTVNLLGLGKYGMQEEIGYRTFWVQWYLLQ